MAPLKYWIWLSALKGIGAKTAVKLLDRFGTPEQVYFARESEYEEIEWLTSRERSALLDKDLSKARYALDMCEQNGVRIMTAADTDYPSRLKSISDPPLVLYIKGRFPYVDEEAAIAIVGTRKCTPYGIRAAEKIGYEIASSGGVVVTGLARGIDSAAAAGALRAGGRVIGVLGCGIDIVYPSENAKLFADVAASGAIVTEYLPGTPALSENFPVRNRILSGLSVASVVIEAPKRSGALITASRALDQGRDVFVVPGNIDSPASAGSNRLLHEGAYPALCGWDIMEPYAAMYPEKVRRNDLRKTSPLDDSGVQKLVSQQLPSKKPEKTDDRKIVDKPKTEEYIDLKKQLESLDAEELAVVSAIPQDETHVDDIIDTSGLPASKVLSALTMLELKGYVTQKSGKRFTLNIREK